MNVTFTSLEALILKATHESLPYPDPAALDAFCVVMRNSVEGPLLASQVVAARIHSPNPQEALLALTLLDRTMRRSDASFHAEIGKFRFLNEMIKLVSPKYLADRTSPEVRTRVLQLLHAWSIEYPKESKFKVAYDMLKFQGVVKETPPPLPPEDGSVPSKSRSQSTIFEDEEKSKLLKKLLQSKKPEDIQHANRLIKTMVKEEERRNEASSRRAQEVSTALYSAGLLRDMVACAASAGADERELMHELSAVCARVRLALQQIATNETLNDLTDILQAIDTLDEVDEMYKQVINKGNNEQQSEKQTTTQAITNESLLDFAGANVVTTNIIKEPVGMKNGAPKNSSLDVLGDIFSTGSDSNIAEPLKPVSLLANDDVDLLGEPPKKEEGWNELDSLGEQLLKQALPENVVRADSFNNSKSKKIPMNALASPKHDVQNGAMLDLDFLIKKSEEESKDVEKPMPEQITPEAVEQNDDVMVDISEPTITTSEKINNKHSLVELKLPVDNSKNEVVETKKSKGVVKPLTDINVTLDSVSPSKVPPLTVFKEEEGLTVVLHFCKDKPRPDVNVLVLSTTSRNSSPIEDYKFQGVVPKGCKVRLLEPSGTSLPAFNPFLPPPALTQVMLVGRPSTSPPIAMKFVITYTCDEDTCSEMGEVQQLPLDDV